MVSTTEKEDTVSEAPAGGSRRNVGPAPVAPSRSTGGSAFHLFKPGQGVYVRWGTAAGLGLLSLGMVGFIRSSVLMRMTSNELALNLIPVVILAGLAWLIFNYVGRNRRVCEFLIATEGEMKKVNWSTFEEVRTATKVVIFVVAMIGLGLFLVDLLFMFLFSAIDVLQVGVFAGSGQ